MKRKNPHLWQKGCLGDESDATIASLITDGCNMGIKSLHMYMNKYPEADDTSKDICKKLVSIESKLCEEMQPYL